MYLAIILGLSIVMAVFALQNAYPVTVTFLWWSFDMSLVLIILGATCVGAVMAGIIGSVKVVRLKMQGWELAADNRKLMTEMQMLERQTAAREAEENKSQETPPA